MWKRTSLCILAPTERPLLTLLDALQLRAMDYGPENTTFNLDHLKNFQGAMQMRQIFCCCITTWAPHRWHFCCPMTTRAKWNLWSDNGNPFVTLHLKQCDLLMSLTNFMASILTMLWKCSTCYPSVRSCWQKRRPLYSHWYLYSYQAQAVLTLCSSLLPLCNQPMMVKASVQSTPITPTYLVV